MTFCTFPAPQIPSDKESSIKVNTWQPREAHSFLFGENSFLLE